MRRKPHAISGRDLLVAVGLWCTAPLTSAPLHSQQAALKVTRLRPPTATLSEEFNTIAAVRELRDGRVLVSDEKDGRLVVVNFTTGGVTEIGRKGGGPGEYRQVGRIWPLGSDSTLVKEPFAPRWLLLRGAEVVATLGPGDRTVAQVGTLPVMGTDTLDGVVTVQFGRDGSGRFSPIDSLAIVRVNLRTQRVDTLGRLRSSDDWAKSVGVSSAPAAVAAAGGGTSGPRRYVVALQAPDQVAVFPDGSIAIARVEPYRVDWCAPRRRCEIGRPISEPRVAMSRREQQAYLEVSRRTHSWPPTTNIDETTGWPGVVPAFVAPAARIDGGAVWALPDNRVLIERLPSATAMLMRYDIVSRLGVRDEQLQLPLGERVVGFGARTVYVAVTDEDGVQRLRRHPWP